MKTCSAKPHTRTRTKKQKATQKVKREETVVKMMIIIIICNKLKNEAFCFLLVVVFCCVAVELWLLRKELKDSVSEAKLCTHIHEEEEKKHTYATVL